MYCLDHCISNGGNNPIKFDPFLRINMDKDTENRLIQIEEKMDKLAKKVEGIVKSAQIAFDNVKKDMEDLRAKYLTRFPEVTDENDPTEE